MAKISELDPLIGSLVDPDVDLLAIVDTSGSETMRITVAELFGVSGGGSPGGNLPPSSITPVTPFKLLGRYSPTSGPAQHIGLSSEFSLSGGVLAVANLPGGIVGTGIDAANITAGILPPARLSLTRTQLNTAVSDADVAFTTISNSFTALNTFNVGIATNGAITFSPIATPTAPSGGRISLYEKSNGKLYTRNSSGLETEVGGSGSIPAGVALLASNNAFTANNTFGGSVTAPVIYTETLLNPTFGSNSCIGLLATGTMVKRNIPDGAAALSVIQENASSTGDILHCTGALGYAFRVLANKRSQFTGNVSIGPEPYPNVKLHIEGETSSNAFQYGIISIPVASVEATSAVIGIKSGYVVSANAHIPDGVGVCIFPPNLGASATVTNAIGIQVLNQSHTAVTNSIGVEIKDQTGTGIGLKNEGTSLLLREMRIGSNVSDIEGLILNGVVASRRSIHAETGGVRRWNLILADTTAESGSNAGSDFQLVARNDAGASIDTPIKIFRAATGNIEFGRNIFFRDPTTLGVGTAPVANCKLNINGVTGGNAYQYGIISIPIASTEATAAVISIKAGFQTSASTIATDGMGLCIFPPSIGVASTVTTATGIQVMDQYHASAANSIAIDIAAQGGSAIGLRNAGSSVLSGKVNLAGATLVASIPASAAAAGVQGDIGWDASFLYVCVAANTWKRSAIAAW